jgi:hypothetical protein
MNIQNNMLNSTVEVHVYREDNRTKYRWRSNRNNEWEIMDWLNEKRIFRMIFRDIYKDKIPVGNIHIDPTIITRFEEYRSNHRSQIAILSQHNHPVDWSIPNYIFPDPCVVLYDSDGDYDDLE